MSAVSDGDCSDGGNGMMDEEVGRIISSVTTDTEATSAAVTAEGCSDSAKPKTDACTDRCKSDNKKRKRQEPHEERKKLRSQSPAELGSCDNSEQSRQETSDGKATAKQSATSSPNSPTAVGGVQHGANKEDQDSEQTPEITEVHKENTQNKHVKKSGSRPPSRSSSRISSRAGSKDASPASGNNSCAASRKSSRGNSRSSSRGNSRASSRGNSRASSRGNSRASSLANSRSSSPIPSTSGMVSSQECVRQLTEQLLKALKKRSTSETHRISSPRKKRAGARTPSKCGSHRTPSKSPVSYRCKNRTPLKSPRRKTPRKSPFLQVRLPAIERSPCKASARRRLNVSPGRSPVKRGSMVKVEKVGTADSPEESVLSSADEQAVADDLRLSSSSSSDDDDDQYEDCLTILTPDHKDFLDKILDEKSDKVNVNITAKNVKSIIHQVITNEHVMDMIRNTLQEEEGLSNHLKEAMFEPKMTRSKVKEVIKKSSLDPHWALSPIKGLPEVQNSPPHFLEMNFSDNEAEDDEYRPSREELEGASDDDDESVNTSVFGSPMPSTAPMTPMTPMTPSTPNSLHIVSEEDPLIKTHSTPVLGPPEGDMPSAPKPGDRAAAAAQQEAEEAELVAQRTRSKMPLKDTPLEEIESNFVAPDITADMYDTSYRDQDWSDFLSGLTSTKPDLNDTTEDDPNDPEYNFMAEAQKTKDDVEDFRDDRAVRIPKKELNELMDELFEAYGGVASSVLNEEESQPGDSSMSQLIKPELEPEQNSQSEQPENMDSTTATESSELRGQGQGQTRLREVTEESEVKVTTSSQYPGYTPPLKMDPALVTVFMTDLLKITGKEDSLPCINMTVPQQSISAEDCPKLTDSELSQLHDQMRKHVQLLAQTFVQAGGALELSETSNNTKLLLFGLQALGDQSPIPGGCTSAFHPPNLAGALQLASYDFHKDNSGSRSHRMRILKAQITKECENLRATKLHSYLLSYDQMELLSTSPVFIFPQMLPEVRLQPPETHTRTAKRVTFTDAEDVLLAMGLEQFRYVSTKYSWIQKYLLPSKGIKQLQLRVKNLRGSRCGSNVIKTWLKSNRLPEQPKYEELETISEIVPPQDRDPELMPEWWPAFEIARNIVLGKEIPEDMEDGSDNETEAERKKVPRNVMSPLDGLKKKPLVGVSSLKDFALIKAQQGHSSPLSHTIRLSNGESLQLAAPPEGTDVVEDLPCTAESSEGSTPAPSSVTASVLPPQVVINSSQVVTAGPGGQNTVFMFTPQQLGELGIQMQVPVGEVPVAPSPLSPVGSANPTVSPDSINSPVLVVAAPANFSPLPLASPQLVGTSSRQATPVESVASPFILDPATGHMLPLVTDPGNVGTISDSLGNLTQSLNGALSQPVPVSQPVMTPVSHPMVTPISQPMVTPISQPMVTPISQSMVTPISQSMMTPVSQPMVIPISQPLVTPICQSMVTPISQSMMTPVSQPMVIPISQPLVTPICQSMVTPISQPMVTPISQSMVTPICQSMVTPISQPMVTPISQPMVTPIIQSVVTPICQSMVTPISQSMVTPISQPMVTPISQSIKPISQSMVTPISRSMTPISQSMLTPISPPMVTPISQSMTPISQSMTPISQSMTHTSQSMTPTSQSMTPISQSMPPISQPGLTSVFTNQQPPEDVNVSVTCSDVGPVVSLSPADPQSSPFNSPQTILPDPVASPASPFVPIVTASSPEVKVMTPRRVHPVFARARTRTRKRPPPQPLDENLPLIGQPAVLGIPCLSVARESPPVTIEARPAATAEPQPLLSMPDLEALCGGGGDVEMEQAPTLEKSPVTQGGIAPFVHGDNILMSSTPKAVKRTAEPEGGEEADMPDYSSPSHSLIRHAFSEAMGMESDSDDTDAPGEEMPVQSAAVAQPPEDLTVAGSPLASGGRLATPCRMVEAQSATVQDPGVNTQIHKATVEILEVSRVPGSLEEAGEVKTTDQAPPMAPLKSAEELNMSTVSTVAMEVSGISELPASESSFFNVSGVDMNERSIDFSDVDIELPADHHIDTDTRTQDVPHFSCVTTPLKMSRRDYHRLDITPVKSDYSESDHSLGFGDSPGGVSLKTPTTTPEKGGETPTKKAIQIMAQLAQLITPTKSPSKRPTMQASLPARKSSSSLFKSPKKSCTTVKSPLKILPNQVLALSPVKSVVPLPKVKSPRRKLLQQRAREILPKGFVVTAPQVSPVKKAAASIRAKAKRGGRPKPPVMRKLLPLLPKLLRASEAASRADEMDNNTDFTSEYETLDSEYCSDEDDDDDDDDIVYDDDVVVYDDDDDEDDDEEEGIERLKTPSPPVKKPRKRVRRRPTVKETMDSGSENEDSNERFSDHDGDSQDDMDDEDHMAELMAASTTIGFTSKKGLVECTDSLKRNKSQMKKEILLKMLAPDLVDSDPMRDERDTAFAQDYLLKVREALKSDHDKYGQFLQILYEFGNNDRAPVELYEELGKLFADQPDLLYDFAGFLLPDQAKQCGCLMANLEFSRVRIFLRKLEVNFRKHPSHLQKILKVFSHWQSNPEQGAAELKDNIKPLLRGQQHLLDEFCLFFEDEKPPDCLMTEFETVTMDDSDGEHSFEFDGYEEVTLPDDESRYQGTRWCRCHCHSSGKKKYSQKKRHCMVCGIKIINGRLYLRTTEKILRPLHVVVHGQPPRPRSDDEDSNPEEGVVSDEDEVIEEIPEILDGEDLEGDLDEEMAEVESYNDTAFDDEVNENIRPPKKQVKKSKKLKLKKSLRDGSASRVQSCAPVTYVNEESILPECSTAGKRKVLPIRGPTDFSALRHHIQHSPKHGEVPTTSECKDPELETSVSRDQPAGNRNSSGVAHKITDSDSSSNSNSKSAPSVDDSDVTLQDSSMDSEHTLDGAGSHQDDKSNEENSLDTYVDNGKDVADSRGSDDRDSAGSGEDEVSMDKPGDDESSRERPNTDTCTVHSGETTSTECDKTSSNSVPDAEIVMGESNSGDTSKSGTSSETTETCHSEMSSFTGKLTAKDHEDTSNPRTSSEKPETCQPETSSFAGKLPAKEISAVETSAENADCDLVEGASCSTGEGQSSDSHSASQESREWTCEEDKLILEMCKELGPTETAFGKIAEQLTSSTAEQICSRFQLLMQLFAAEGHSESESESEVDAEDDNGDGDSGVETST